MNQDKLSLLERTFGIEKLFVENGYYRIRTLSDEVKELAYLIPDPCGATIVHPQITIELKENMWIATKLIDMEVTPTQLISRNSNTEKYLDNALKILVHQFEEIQKKIEHRNK